MAVFDSDDLNTFLTDFGETFELADSTSFTGIWNFQSQENELIRGGTLTILARRADTECIVYGDSLYRLSDEPPIEYKVRDIIKDGLESFDTLVLEKQDVDC